MMMQMIVGTIIMPVTPKIIEKIGNRKTAILSMLIQGISLIVLFVGYMRILLLILSYLQFMVLDILQDHVVPV